MKLLRRQRSDQGALTQAQGAGPWRFGDFNRLRNEIERLFESPFGLLSPSSTGFFEGWEPTLNVYEDRDKITVQTELPGMKKQDINISLVGNTLTISGERKQEEEKGEGETYRSERYFGRFQRVVTLPTQVDANKVQANYKDGVLTITLPKAEEAKPKQIAVNVK